MSSREVAGAPAPLASRPMWAQPVSSVKATVKGTHDAHANYLLKWFQETAPMAEIDTEELKLFVHEALADGRSPNTLLGKDLPLLARCFRWAGIEDRVSATRAQLRRRPR